jgi:hypothetical protein
VSVITGKVSSSTLVEVTSLPRLRTPQENEEQTWKYKKSFTKRKCLRTKTTGIYYKMHEIKHIYCSLNSVNKEAWLWLL